jgi:hypothetical protein
MDMELATEALSATEQPRETISGDAEPIRYSRGTLPDLGAIFRALTHGRFICGYGNAEDMKIFRLLEERTQEYSDFFADLDMTLMRETRHGYVLYFLLQQKYSGSYNRRMRDEKMVAATALILHHFLSTSSLEKSIGEPAMVGFRFSEQDLHEAIGASEASVAIRERFRSGQPLERTLNDMVAAGILMAEEEPRCYRGCPPLLRIVAYANGRFNGSTVSAEPAVVDSSAGTSEEGSTSESQEEDDSNE